MYIIFVEEIVFGEICNPHDRVASAFQVPHTFLYICTSFGHTLSYSVF
jgi:hypothetical protein